MTHRGKTWTIGLQRDVFYLVKRSISKRQSVGSCWWHVIYFRWRATNAAHPVELRIRFKQPGEL